MFEPYFSTKDKGTGLGLAIVSNIVADHQGFIRVRDNQPQGTTIVIELPGGSRTSAESLTELT
jgi:two-component system nitrogen regulation sensor histidine kinase NtrY